jgi:GxxExxY protein
MLINDITDQIIAAAIKVHRYFGPGLFEQVYKACLFRELQKRSLTVAKEVALPAVYEGELVDCGYRIDLLVESSVIVELKSVEHLTELHRMQLLTYLRLARKEVGLLLNFNALHLKRGIIRVVNGYQGTVPSVSSAPPR